MDLHDAPLTKEYWTLLFTDILAFELMLQGVDQVVDDIVATFNQTGRPPSAARSHRTRPDPGNNTDKRPAPPGAAAPGTP